MKIFSADWVIPISSEPIQKGAIAFSGDKIIAVGKTEKLIKEFPEAEIEDLGESALMPGFVNCHSHLELSIMRGFLDDVEDNFFSWLIKTSLTRSEKLTLKDIEISALLGATEGIQTGVTCFGDIGRYGRAGFEALKKTGLRGIVYQETEFSPYNENSVEDFANLQDKFLELRAEETNLVKAGISPHAPYTVSRKLFEKITDYSLAENIKISTHAAESHLEEELMIHNSGLMADFYRERGIDWTAPRLSSIQYLAEVGVLEAKPLLAHCIRTNEQDWQLIGKYEAGIAHCPRSNAKFGHRTAPLEMFLDNDLRVGLGSDSVASNNTCDILAEAGFAALAARSREDKKRLISAQEALEMMTLGGAKSLRMEDEIGTLESGKQADLVVISLKNIARQPIHDIYSSLIFASNSGDVTLTMVAGKEIYREGKNNLIEQNELKKQVKEIAQKMQDV